LELEASSDERIERFQKILFENNITAIIRKSKGKEIMAACGQLAGSMILGEFKDH
jgi:23S rRNA (adenine2503-C2)-methyltransferase